MRSIENNKKKMTNYEADRAKHLEKLEKLQGVSDNLRNLTNEIQVQKSHLRILAEEKERARSELKEEFEDSTEELQSAQKNVQLKLSQCEKQVRALEEEAVRLVSEKSRHEKDLNSITMSIGKAKVMEDQYNRDKKDCEDITIRCCDKYRFSDIDQDGDLKVDTFEKVHRKLLGHAREHQTKVERHKEETKRGDEGYEKKISTLAAEVNRLEEKRGLQLSQKDKKMSRIKEMESEKRNIRSRIGSHDDATINEQIRRAESELADLKSRSNFTKLEAEISEIIGNLDANTSDLEVYKMQEKEFSAHNEARNRLKFRRRNLRNLQVEMEEKLRSRRNDLESLLGVSKLEPRTLNEDLKASHRKATDDLKDEDSKMNEIQQKISSTEGELRYTKRQLEKMKADMSKEKEVFKRKDVDLRGKSLSVLIEETEGRHRNAREQMELWEPFKKIYDMFKTQAAKKHECPLCTRCMNDDEYKTFRDAVDEKVLQLSTSDQKDKFKEKEKKYREQLNTLRSLTGNWTNLKSLKEQYPKVSQRASKLDQKVQIFREEVQKFSASRESKQTRKKSIESCMPVVSAISHLFAKCLQEQKLIQIESSRLQSELKEVDFEKVEKEIKRLEGENLQLNRKLGELQKLQSHSMSKTQHLQAKLNNLREKKTQHERLHLKLESLDQEKKRIESSLEEIDEYVQQCALKIQPIRQNIESERHHRREYRQKRAKQEEILTQSKQSLLREIDTLKGKIESLRNLGSFAAREQRQKLFSQKAQIEKIITDAEAKAAEIGKRKARKTKDLQQSRDLVEKITQMLRYREKVAKVVRAKKTIVKLQDQLKTLGGINLSESTEQVRARVQESQTKIDMIQGKLLAQKEQVRTQRAELSTPRLRNIRQRHRKLMIECQVNKLALGDMESYSKALEKALMEFHSAKMAEINEVLRDLWQSTYCGNDIEEIQIESDYTQEVRGRRQYNYRVIMKQRDAVLDMRGRCSAGQKVLASLLIRLALAETFCTKCGVLALDEPTTNLDKANIAQLARALNNIIQQRAGQENFQIIVITHDEEFVDLLGQRDHCDYYYRVYKDDEQCSRITQQPFHQQ